MVQQQRRQRQATDNSSSSKAGNALAMAREKLQSSAREWIRNIEDAVMTTSSSASSASTSTRRELHRLPDPSTSIKEGAASIENALRMMFGSCTTGAAEATIAPTRTLSQADDSETEQVTRRTELPLNVPRATHARRHSCPKPPAVTPSPPAKPRRVTSDSKQQQQPSAQLGEHIYAQLFHDDHPTTTTRPIPKPFPVSSPPRRGPVPSQELHLPCQSFDDSISAISQNTLEAMAAMPHAQSALSNDSTTLFPQQQHESASFGRVRSHQSKSSRQSKTTYTTETSGSSFEIWQAQEQEYWKNAEAHPHDGFLSVSLTDVQPVVKRDFSQMGEI